MLFRSRTKSHNTPFLDKQMTGMVTMTLVSGLIAHESPAFDAEAR